MELADATLLDLFLLYNDELRIELEIEKLLGMIFQAAKGLDFLNAHNHTFEGKIVGLQHGDVKPNNLMMVGEKIKLADYGLATPLNNATAPCHRHGTLEYVAPEVIKGTVTDFSDQFSLAVTYFVLRTGKFPFPPPPSHAEAIKRGLNRPLPEVSLIANHVEQAIIMKALSPIPQNRFPSCLDFVRSLAKANDLEFYFEADEKKPISVRPIRSSHKTMA
jgi:serine/threonine protein kinase, bacterial